jgi:hypothetical protein
MWEYLFQIARTEDEALKVQKVEQLHIDDRKKNKDLESRIKNLEAKRIHILDHNQRTLILKMDLERQVKEEKEKNKMLMEGKMSNVFKLQAKELKIEIEGFKKEIINW